MTNAWLADTATDFHDAFRDAGMADLGVLHLSATRTTIPDVRVYVDRDIATAALAGVQISAGQALVRIVRDASIPATPRAGDTITIDGDVLTIARRDRDNEAEWVFVCQA